MIRFFSYLNSSNSTSTKIICSTGSNMHVRKHLYLVLILFFDLQASGFYPKRFYKNHFHSIYIQWANKNYRQPENLENTPEY